MWCRPQGGTKTSSRRMNDIDVLSEQLGSLQITNKTLDKITEQSDEAISVAPVPVTMNTNKQAFMPKNMVPDPGWFNGNKMKFKDQWRGM